MDCRGVGRHQRVEFAKAKSDGAAVETDGQLAGVEVDIVDVADVTIIDLLFVVVLDLHDLIPWREGPAEPLDLALAGGIQGGLQFDVERSGADAAAVHGTQHLDVSDGIKTETLGASSPGRRSAARRFRDRPPVRNRSRCRPRAWRGPE